MRAVVCEKLGDPTLPLGAGILRLAEDIPSPEVKAGCVKIRVTAASLNFPDALQIKVGHRVLHYLTADVGLLAQKTASCLYADMYAVSIKLFHEHSTTLWCPFHNHLINLSCSFPPLLVSASSGSVPGEAPPALHTWQ